MGATEKEKFTYYPEKKLQPGYERLTLEEIKKKVSESGVLPGEWKSALIYDNTVITIHTKDGSSLQLRVPVKGEYVTLELEEIVKADNFIFLMKN
jgi:hypothetical protein